MAPYALEPTRNVFEPGPGTNCVQEISCSHGDFKVSLPKNAIMCFQANAIHTSVYRNFFQGQLPSHQAAEAAALSNF